MRNPITGQGAMPDNRIEETIKTWPSEDRPREKLLNKGPGALSNSELLAILLRTGSRGDSAVALAQRIMQKFGTFRNMSHTDVRDWKDMKGLGPVKLAQIMAALEIGRRFREDESLSARQKISSARDIVDILQPRLRDLKTEVIKIVHLNSDNRIIDIQNAASGTVNQAIPIVREIMHAALQQFAAAMICVHNHPSGAVAPSTADRTFTRNLVAAGRLMGIQVLDHVIIGGDTFYSFADDGCLE